MAISRLGSRRQDAAVWRAREAGGDRVVVVKIARVGGLAARRYRDEAVALERIPSAEARAAHLAPLVQWGEDNHVVWLEVEDAGPETLRRTWSGQRVPFDEALDVAVAVSRALACLNRHALLHGDVTETNVVVRPDVAGPGRFTLVDLDNARQVGPGGEVTLDRGTERRTPPEANLLGQHASVRYDVGSLCLMLAANLMGRPDRSWPASLPDQLRETRLDPGDARHRAFVRLVHRGQAFPPSRRPSAAAFASEVEDLLAGRVGWRRPRARRAAAAAALVMTAGVAGASRHPIFRPHLYFEDASVAWALPLPTRDARETAPGVRSSGFMYIPTLIDADEDGTPEVYLPRSTRPWVPLGASGLRDDLLGRVVQGAFLFEPAPVPRPDLPVQWVDPVDLDLDGHRDLVLFLQDLSKPGSGGEGGDRTTFLLGPAPYRATGDLLPRSVPGRPFVLPGGAGGHPEVLFFGAPHSPRVLSWVDGGYRLAEDRPGRPAPIEWLDIDGDGRFEKVGRDGWGGLVLSRRGIAGWKDETLTDTPVQIAHFQGRSASVSAGDLDGDGDEDLVALTSEVDRPLAWRNERGRLVSTPLGGVELRDRDEELASSHTSNSLQLADLDGDGLPELLLPSGGFPKADGRGAIRSKVWHNEGRFQFRRVPLPRALSEPHDGSRYLVLDVDRDGLPDLLDLSINDEFRDVPSHRGLRTRSRGRDRVVGLRVRLPGARDLPLGTRLQSIAGRSWSTVVRGAGPVLVPSWVAGDLLVELPDGRIAAARLPAAGSLPVTLDLPLLPLPTLYAAGGDPIEPGRAREVDGEVVLHARAGGWDVVVSRTDRGGVVSARNGDRRWEWTGGRVGPGLGCDGDGRCLLLEQQSAGGYLPLEIDLPSGRATLLSTISDLPSASAVRAGQAFTAEGGRIHRRDRSTFGSLAAGSPGVAWEGLAARDDRLAACAIDPPGLVELDVISLSEVSRIPVLTAGPCSVVPTPAGWAVTTRRGFAWVGPGAQVRSVDLGEAVLLVEDGRGVWAVGAHRAVRFDAATGRPVGGLVAPGLGRSRPVGEEGSNGMD